MMKFTKLPAAALLAASLLAAAPAAHADDSSAFHFELHGIAGASMYVQSNPDFVLNGQGPLLLRANNGGATTTGFDVRQTRLSFQVTGPEVFMGAKTKAVIETDFFNLAGPGGYGEINMMNRLRLAYSELNWGDTQVRIGQDWELLFNEFPTSLGHMAFPVTYFAGLSGWRAAGFEGFHTFHFGEENNLQVAASITRSDWESPSDFGNTSSALLDVSSGQLSALPAGELRAKYNFKEGFVYVAGHWSRVDGTKFSSLLNSAGPTSSTKIPANRNWDVEEVKLGGKYQLANWTVQGDVYAGKNTAPLIGEQLTWFTANDVKEWGAWLQAGYNFTKELSLWGVYGTTQSNKDEVTSAGGGPYANTVFGGLFQYRDGAFGVGPEVYFVNTKSTLAAGTGAPTGNIKGTQVMLSGMYFF